jgi:hypothetical protein
MLRSHKDKKRGQMSVEYIIIVSMLVMVLFTLDLGKNFRESIDFFFSDISTMMNLPIP